MQSCNDLLLNNSILDEMLITPWNFNYHNDGNTWSFSFNPVSELTLFVMALWCDMVGLKITNWAWLMKISPETLHLILKTTWTSVYSTV